MALIYLIKQMTRQNFSRELKSMKKNKMETVELKVIVIEI